MIARILVRLAVVWIVGWGCLLLLGFALGGAMEKGATWAIPLILFGPPAIALALAWVCAPRK
jgi:hypothetical protein